MFSLLLYKASRREKRRDERSWVPFKALCSEMLVYRRPRENITRRRKVLSSSYTVDTAEERNAWL